MYYVGMGGNTNTTTRFRRYDGKGEKRLLAEYLDKAHLLEGNREYAVRITVADGFTSFAVDGETVFSYRDLRPLKDGYFGFRTTWSRQEIDDFEVRRLK
jgi:rhamnogalacturonan endolyase